MKLKLHLKLNLSLQFYSDYLRGRGLAKLVVAGVDAGHELQHLVGEGLRLE